jgi:hypothetical protein
VVTTQTRTSTAQAAPGAAPAGRSSALRIAVLIPCFNEEAAIARVVADFRAALPDAAIHVYDNNSTDRTAAVAGRAGAIVGYESRRGKGHVVRRMFADVDADVFLLTDGDATYDAASAPELVNKLIHESLSRRFVKSFPALSTGFEIETELTIHALELGMPVGEVETPYFARPAGSASKLSTWRDGWRIAHTIERLYRNERPLQFFGLIATGLATVSIVLAAPVIGTFIETGTVPRLPTAVLATGIMLAAALSLVAGLVLDTVTRGRREMKRLAYLAHRAPHHAERRAPDTA